MGTVWRVLTRKKVLDPVSVEESQLGRVLTTLDLTALGVGSTLGVGVYVLAGHVAKDTAGPAVVLSFLIATIASVFAGLCYAEFGARAPRAGSAYIYSYVCVGEFIAFVIGWNLLLEYVIGSASVARGLSLYLDTLLNHTLETTFRDIAPIDCSFMSEYFDFFAFAISMLLSVALAFGMKESSIVNNIFTLLNLAVVLFVVIAGSIKADAHNWDLPKNSSIPDSGSGGFFPFGIEGMIKGAATCFYGFVGFDCIATTGEEVKNPKRAIPISIVVSLFIIFLAYFGTSTVITLMLPYYEQNANAPIPHAFEMIGWEFAKWIVAIGGIFGLCASLFGAMFPLPRIIYAMASDGLVFRFLGKVSARFKTPVVGTLIAGLLTGLMAAMFELKQLVNMMSIGTLLAYTIVAACVLLLRYAVDKGEIYEPLRTASDSEDSETYAENNRNFDINGSNEEIELTTSDSDGGTVSAVLKQIFNCGRHQEPTTTSEKIVTFQVCFYCVLCVLIGLCAMYLKTPISNAEIWAIVLTALVVAVAVLVIMSIATQPRSRKELSFKVPLVPLLPALSILINIYLMLMLDEKTWIRFAVWMVVGIPIYYFSVKNQFDARNMSLSSSAAQIGNGKVNGYSNQSYVEDEINVDESEDQTLPSKKRPAPLPPSLEIIDSTLAVLDEILEKEEESSNLFSDRKLSADSIANVSHREDVEADVHRVDVAPPFNPPVIVITESPPLVQSSDVALESYDEIASPEAPIEEKDSLVPPMILVANEDDVPVPPPPPINEQFSFDQSNNDPPIREATLLSTSASEEDLAIPSPPPFLFTIDENADMNIPRPHFHSSAFQNVKLRHVPETPPVDYSRHNSVDDNPSDHLKFGSEEHKAFMYKLNRELQQGLPANQPPVIRSPIEIDRDSVRENVIEEGVNKENVKEKLTEFLRRSPYLPGTEPVLNKVVAEEKKDEEKKYDENQTDDFKEQHRRNMQNAFDTIKLRKPDGVDDDDDDDVFEEVEVIPKPPPIPVNTNNDDKVRHRDNMDSVLRSIRLRKVDSFKVEDDKTQS